MEKGQTRVSFAFSALFSHVYHPLQSDLLALCEPHSYTTSGKDDNGIEICIRSSRIKFHNNNKYDGIAFRSVLPSFKCDGKRLSSRALPLSLSRSLCHSVAIHVLAYQLIPASSVVSNEAHTREFPSDGIVGTRTHTTCHRADECALLNTEHVFIYFEDVYVVTCRRVYFYVFSSISIPHHFSPRPFFLLLLLAFLYPLNLLCVHCVARRRWTHTIHESRKHERVPRDLFTGLLLHFTTNWQRFEAINNTKASLNLSLHPPPPLSTINDNNGMRRAGPNAKIGIILQIDAVVMGYNAIDCAYYRVPDTHSHLAYHQLWDN